MHISDKYPTRQRTYDGDWKNGLPHGFGKLTFCEVDHAYEGELRADKKDGQGRYWYPDGVYDGEWKNELRDGFGKFEWNIGHVYEGQWKNDMRTGHGRFTWPDGNFYEGPWLNNQREGIGGVQTTSNGDKYTGTYENDQPIGIHTYAAKNGETGRAKVVTSLTGSILFEKIE